MLARLRHHLAALEGIGNRDQKAAGGRHLAARITSGSAALPAMVSEPLLLQPVDPVDSSSITRSGVPVAEQSFADEAADTAMADQHDMIGQRRHRDRLARGFGLRCRAAAVRSFAASLAPGQRSSTGEEQRIEQDREDRAGEDQVAPALRQQPEAHAEPGQDEGELADLREARRDRQRGRVRMPEQPHDR